MGFFVHISKYNKLNIATVILRVIISQNFLPLLFFFFLTFPFPRVFRHYRGKNLDYIKLNKTTESRWYLLKLESTNGPLKENPWIQQIPILLPVIFFDHTALQTVVKQIIQRYSRKTCSLVPNWWRSGSYWLHHSAIKRVWCHWSIWFHPLISVDNNK